MLHSAPAFLRSCERSGAERMTKPDDASAASCWRPILSGTAAPQALQAGDAIAESITPIAGLLGERDPSLGRGQAGLALLYTWLARTRRMPQADVLARQCLDQAIEAVSTQAMNASLYGGFPGVAWAAELVDRLLDPDAEDRNEAIDDALLRLLSRVDRWSAPPAEILDQESRRQYPSGRADLGVAHGVAGPIALLGGICGARVEQATARPLLEGAVSWLLAHSVPTQAGPTFPVWVAPGFQPWPARCAWCYGDPGIAAAPLLEVRGARDAGCEQTAVA